MKHFKRGIYFVAAFTLTLGGLFAVFTQTKLFEVSRIPVEIETTDLPADVRIEGDLRSKLTDMLAQKNQAIQGHKIWDIDISGLQTLLQKEEWVKSVRVSRLFPNAVKISVQPKTPFALFLPEQSSGSLQTQMRVITSDASFLPLPGSSAVLDLPIVRGDKIADDPAARKKLIDFIGSLPATGALSRANIGEISYAKDDGYTLFLINSRTEIKLGEDRIITKIARVSQVLDYLNANSLKGRVIDASFSKKVLVRLRKDP